MRKDNVTMLKIK